MSHATACHVQLILGNCINLYLHVSHPTEFQSQMTVAKPKISSSVVSLINNNYKTQIGCLT